MMENPTESRRIDSTDCFTCCRKEMEEIIAAINQRAPTSTDRQVESTRTRGRPARESDVPMSPAYSPAAAKNQGVVCDCQGDLTESNDGGSEGDDVVPCARCGQHQHVKCMAQGTDYNDSASSSACNKCHRTAQGVANRTKAKRARDTLDHSQEDAYGRAAEDIWRHYCDLNSGSASSAVIAATRMEYKQGRMVPVHAAPQTWVEELQARVNKMMQVAGPKLADFVTSSETFGPQTTESVLRQWRALAMYLVHHGPYKGKRSELGLLGEVIGLEEKGTYWTGEI